MIAGASFTILLKRFVAFVVKYKNFRGFSKITQQWIFGKIDYIKKWTPYYFLSVTIF